MAIKTDEQAEEVIRLQGIGKSYYIGDQEVPVLTHIDLSITKGEFVYGPFRGWQVHTDEYLRLS